jgi:hypothetical protein
VEIDTGEIIWQGFGVVRIITDLSEKGSGWEPLPLRIASWKTF